MTDIQLMVLTYAVCVWIFLLSWPMILGAYSYGVGFWTRGRVDVEYGSSWCSLMIGQKGSPEDHSSEYALVYVMGGILVLCAAAVLLDTFGVFFTLITPIVIISLIFIPRLVMDIRNALRMTNKGDSSRLDEIEKLLNKD